ncbi:MAG: GGDEF domain-containing protein, partial [Clostridia bacterium]|nr:GGDEF domain-containing protein [Clostridia bacterium]
MNENRKRQHFRRAVMLAVVLVTLAALLGIEYSILNGNNRIHAFRTESILADQVGTILESNLQKTELLREELKENYISKAKTVAYMLEKSPELERDVRELERIAGLMSIDEIHIFDDTGTIIAGSVPKYFGYSFESGEQIAYFRPMLEDRTRFMCQNV